MITMAAEGILSSSVVSVVEEVLRRHGSCFQDNNLEHRKAEEASLRRYEAAGWLRKMVGVVAAKDLPAEPSEDDFRIALRSGIILCNVLNKVQPGAIQKVVETPNDSVIIPDGAALMAYQYFENVRNFLVNVEEMGLPPFDASDFEQGGKTARIVNCVLALKAYSEGKQGGNGSWRSAGYLRPPISPKPSPWRNSKPFMNSTSRSSSISDKSAEASTAGCGDDAGLDLNSMGNIQTLNMLVRSVLSNRRQDEIPSIIESMLSKVMQEFRHRLSGLNGSMQSISSDVDASSRSKPLVEPSLDETPASSCEETDDASSAKTLRKEDDHDGVISIDDLQSQHNLLALRQLHIQELKHTLNTAKESMQFLKMKYVEDMNNLGIHLSRLVDAASGYHKILAENRKLYNLVQDLKGNIRVYCRVRPFLPGQLKSANVVDHIDEGNITVLTPSKYCKEGRKSFSFNKVFGPMATQAEVFADTQPLVRSVLDGYNVCIFAYGQTGTGKTYTMSGPQELTEETFGVNYRALNDLFDISKQRKDTIRYEVSVQMMEIYNEQVRDLLVVDGSNKKLEIRNSSQNGINVPDANRLPVSSADDVINLMNLGQKNRAVSSTALNDRSSRSHSCLTVHVQGKDLTSGVILHGSMHLVDLAGSERVEKSEVSGDRLKEAVHINKSLSALGDVIASLAQKGAHVPYRNSKLTQLLQDSLGGKAKTLMFIHISPEQDSIGETLSTLKFAERVSTVELGAARVNKESSEVKELKEQIANLKAALAKKEEESEMLSTSSPESRRAKSTSSSPSHPQRRGARVVSRDQRNVEDDIDIKVKRNFASKPRRRSLDPRYLDLSDYSPLNDNVSKQAVPNGGWIHENILKDGRAHGSNAKESQGADVLSTPDRSEPGSIADDAEELDAGTSDSSELEFQAPTSFRRVRSLPDGLPSKLNKPQVRAVKASNTRGILPVPPPIRRFSAGGCPPAVKTGRPVVNTKRINGTTVSK